MPLNFNQSGPFADRGCVSCPDGSRFSSDQVLGVAETFAKNILTKTFENWDGPRFSLSDIPIKASMAVQPDAVTNRMSVFYPHLERTKWYDPVPKLSTEKITKEVIDAAGGIENLDYNHFDHQSLGCAPPLGPRAIAGKDAAYSVEFWTNFIIGPICTTHYRVLEDLIDYFRASEDALRQALELSAQYKRVDQFIAMSRKNCSAVSGTSRPEFFQHQFGEFPDSPGSLEWAIETIDQIASRFPQGKEVRVCVSPQVLQWWVKDFSTRHSVDLNVEFKMQKAEVAGYITQFTGDGDFMVRSVRTGRTIIFDHSRTPCYMLLRQNGPTNWQWAHQPYFVYREGDDYREGEMNGIMQDPNPNFGNANEFHSDGSVLAEYCMVFDDSAFHYESPPVNPFSGAGVGDVMPSLGATQIHYYTGNEVDTYFLDQMRDPTTGQCPNNRLKQWIAGEATQHFIIRENNKYAMGGFMVQVPNQTTVLGAGPTNGALIDNRPQQIELSQVDPVEAKFCEEAPEAPDPVAGCINVQTFARHLADGAEETNLRIKLERTGGLDGELTVDYAMTADTATDGGATGGYTDDSGTITFADGQQFAYLDVEILAWLDSEEEPSGAAHFTIDWTGDGLCFDDDAYAGNQMTTDVYIHGARPAYDNTPSA